MAKINQIGNKTSALEINGAYSLPTVDGTASYVFTTDGSGTVSWQPSDDNLIQMVTVTTGSAILINSSIPDDNTIPQKTEGVEVLTLAITPKSATNILYIEFDTWMSFNSGNSYAECALFQDATTNGIAYAYAAYSSAEDDYLTMRHIMAAGTTSATTFKARVGLAANTGYVNALPDGTQIFGGVSGTILTIREYTP